LNDTISFVCDICFIMSVLEGYSRSDIYLFIAVLPEK